MRGSMRFFSNPMIFVMRGSLLLLLVLALAPRSVKAQPLINMPEAGAEQMAVDSARRVITKRILSDADKREIRACDREKTQFLKQCRTDNPSNTEVDQKLNEAKLRSADPNDPAIQALMEKKFSFEKACDDKFYSMARGAQCSSGEKKRQSALEKALAKDKAYQTLLRHSEAINNEHL
jgi:hypothetical protein